MPPFSNPFSFEPLTDVDGFYLYIERLRRFKSNHAQWKKQNPALRRQKDSRGNG